MCWNFCNLAPEPRKVAFCGKYSTFLAPDMCQWHFFDQLLFYNLTYDPQREHRKFQGPTLKTGAVVAERTNVRTNADSLISIDRYHLRVAL